MDGTQYAKLYKTLVTRARRGQIVSTSDIRRWYYQDWPEETDKPIFPAHFAKGLKSVYGQILPEEPLNSKAREIPLLQKRYDEVQLLIRGSYEVLVPEFVDAPETEHLSEGYESTHDETHKIKQPRAFEASLRQIYEQKQEVLFDPEFFYPLIRRNAPELTEHYDFELAVIYKLINQSLPLTSLLESGLLHQSESLPQLIEILRDSTKLRKEDLEMGLEQLVRVIQPDSSYSSVLNLFLNPMHPHFKRNWQALESVYYEIQADKLELEVYFNQILPDCYAEQDPKEVFSKALDWFLGGKKAYQLSHLSKARIWRQQRLSSWESPGTAFWKKLSPPTAKVDIKQWAQSALAVLMQVPGLDSLSEDHDELEHDSYPAAYMASGILAGLFPQYAFAVSPPSFKGLKQVQSMGLGLSITPEPSQINDLPDWIATVMAQMYHFVQALKTLRPDTADELTPRRMDMLLYLLRNDHRRQKTILKLLDTRTSETSRMVLGSQKSDSVALPIPPKTRPSIAECLQEACLRFYQPGDILTRKQVVEAVHSLYPEIPSTSILPSDYCCNHSNQDPHSGIYHIFELISRGKYRLLDVSGVITPRKRGDRPLADIVN